MGYDLEVLDNLLMEYYFGEGEASNTAAWDVQGLLNLPVEKPNELPCPRCQRTAAPEHVVEVAGRWECKCWWCENEWVHG